MVSSYLDLLERKYEGKVLDIKAKEYMDFAIDGADRMRRMIDDLLTYSRVGTQGRSFSAVRMEEVLETALKDLRKSIEDSSASITSTSLPEIDANRTQMLVLLENLIGNAIKFRGTEPPRINISARCADEEWTFCIEDNGIGIDLKQKDRVFQMFQRLNDRERYEGTGIGLAIAKKIVERHGGRIWLESEVGKGTTFYFTIPVR